MKKPQPLIVLILFTLVILACTCNFSDLLMDAVAEIGPTEASEPTGTPTITPTDTPTDTPILEPTETPLPTATEAHTITPTPEPVYDIGSMLVNPVDGAVLVYVPEGEFLMGSEDQDGWVDEQPKRMVHLEAFYIYQHPVTNAQYRQCVEDDVCELPDAVIYYQDSSYDDHPVVWVSWFNADTYCQWVGGQLLTEAEWEKAARGSDGRRYPWGDQAPTCSLANYYGCMGGTSPVGSYPTGTSPYGALDMAGNVWEWVADWYAEDYYTLSPYENPTGPTSGEFRVLRGGSWGDIEERLWVVNRNGLHPESKGEILGFRCLLREAP